MRLNPEAPDLPTIPVCGNCGAAVDTSGAFCWKCGVPLETGREPFIPAHPESADQPRGAPEPPVVASASLRADLRRFSHRPSRGSRFSRRSIISGILLLSGIALLVVSLLVGWYAVSATASSEVSGTSFTVSATETYYPLNQISEAFTCQGYSGCPQIETTSWTSYSQGTFDSIGTLYDMVSVFVISAIILGLVAAFLFFTGGRQRSRWAQALVLVAIALAMLAPTILFAAQPAVLNSQGTSSGGSSPRTSFFGSCSGSGCATSLPYSGALSASWGPSVGWYLCLVAFALLIVGLYVYRGPRVGSPDRVVYEPVG
jgi:hypothetical protein